VVHQLLTRQTRHEIDQIERLVVLGDQRHGRGGRLELVVLVVDQQRLLIGQRRLDPGSGRRAGKKVMDAEFGIHGANVGRQ